MKKNRKGFTLVELIICIALVAALTVAATLGLQKVLRANKESTYKNDLKDVMTSARTYLDINDITYESKEKSIKLEDLVGEGLLSDAIYDKINGLTCENFTEETKVYYLNINNLKKIYIENWKNNKCYLDTVDSCTLKKGC